MTRKAGAARICMLVASIALLASCVSQESKRDAINEINAAFRTEYETTLARNGTRKVDATSRQSFDAVYAALVKLGLIVREESRALGFISAEGPAPLPLDRNEWEQASANDLPRAKELLRRHLGALAELFHFQPEGLDTVMTATIIGSGSGSEISFTMRMREVAAVKSDLPRREYPPPTALRIGLDKLWAAVDRELGASSRKP